MTKAALPRRHERSSSGDLDVHTATMVYMKGWIATIAAGSLLLAGCGGSTTAAQKPVTVTETQVQSQVTTLTPPPAEPQSSDGSDCQSDPVLGVDPPQVRTICDTAIGPDGSWMRIREFWYQRGQDVQDPSDVIDSKTYTVTADAIPPGEPGHLG